MGAEICNKIKEILRIERILKHDISKHMGNKEDSIKSEINNAKCLYRKI